MMLRELSFMKKAVELSRKSLETREGGPFGCVIAKGDRVVGTGWNRVIGNHDPTAHAEVVAIREACAYLGSHQLTGCDIYASCEPCPMCMGAIYWARPARVYFANTRDDAAALGFDDRFIYEELKTDLQRRSIPFIRVGSAEALEVFREWERNNGGMSY